MAIQFKAHDTAFQKINSFVKTVQDRLAVVDSNTVPVTPDLSRRWRAIEADLADDKPVHTLVAEWIQGQDRQGNYYPFQPTGVVDSDGTISIPDGTRVTRRPGDFVALYD